METREEKIWEHGCVLVAINQLYIVGLVVMAQKVALVATVVILNKAVGN